MSEPGTEMTEVMVDFVTGEMIGGKGFANGGSPMSRNTA